MTEHKNALDMGGCVCMPGASLGRKESRGPFTGHDDRGTLPGSDLVFVSGQGSP